MPGSPLPPLFKAPTQIFTCIGNAAGVLLQEGGVRGSPLTLANPQAGPKAIAGHDFGLAWPGLFGLGLAGLMA
jgi:hypothetical protein